METPERRLGTTSGLSLNFHCFERYAWTRPPFKDISTNFNLVGGSDNPFNFLKQYHECYICLTHLIFRLVLSPFSCFFFFNERKRHVSLFWLLASKGRGLFNSWWGKCSIEVESPLGANVSTYKVKCRSWCLLPKSMLRLFLLASIESSRNSHLSFFPVSQFCFEIFLNLKNILVQ